MVPGFHCTFLPDMLSSPTPGSSTSISRNFDANFDLRRMTNGSALPILPRSVPRGRSISWLPWFASATVCQVARPPVRIRLERPAFGDFYFQAFNGSVSLPVAGYNYNSDWTPLLAGLSPTGIAASLAARSRTTDLRCPHNVGFSLNSRHIAASRRTAETGQQATYALQQFRGDLKG